MIRRVHQQERAKCGLLFLHGSRYAAIGNARNPYKVNGRFAKVGQVTCAYSDDPTAN
jgi:hypothetical protein